MRARQHAATETTLIVPDERTGPLGNEVHYIIWRHLNVRSVTGRSTEKWQRAQKWQQIERNAKTGFSIQRVTFFINH